MAYRDLTCPPLCALGLLLLSAVTSVFAASDPQILYLDDIGRKYTSTLYEGDDIAIYVDVRTRAPYASVGNNAKIIFTVEKPNGASEVYDEINIGYLLLPVNETARFYADRYELPLSGSYTITAKLVEYSGGAFIDDISFPFWANANRWHARVTNNDDDDHTVTYVMTSGGTPRSLLVPSGATVYGPDTEILSGRYTVLFQWTDDDVGTEQEDDDSGTVSAGDNEEYRMTIPLQLPVQNVSAVQRPYSSLVDFTYDLNYFEGGDVSIDLSSDGGSTWDVPLTTLVGDHGAGISAGPGKALVWDAERDLPGTSSDRMMVRVTLTYGGGLSHIETSSAFSFTKPFDRPVVRLDMRSGNVFLSCPTEDGMMYQAWSRDDLRAGSWIPLGASRIGNGSDLVVIDSGLAAPRRFYRVTVTP